MGGGKYGGLKIWKIWEVGNMGSENVNRNIVNIA